MDNAPKHKHHQLPGGGYYLASRFFHYFAYFCVAVEGFILYFTNLGIAAGVIALAIAVVSSLLAGNIMKKSLEVLNDYMAERSIES